MMLYRVSGRRHPCLVLDFSWKHCNWSLLTVMIFVVFHRFIFYQVKECNFYSWIGKSCFVSFCFVLIMNEC